MSTSVLTEFLEFFLGSLTAVGQGIGGALSTMAKAIFVDSSGTTETISTFGAIIAIFGGLALCLGLTRWVVNLISSWGARNR